MTWAELEQVTGSVQNLVAAIAVLVGGVWAYYRVIRNRTFAVRLKLQVSGRLLERGGQQILIATIRAENVGSVKVKLSARGSALAVIGYEALTDVEQAERLPRQRLAMLPVLESHSWIEPVTVIEEKTIVAIERRDFAALGLELRLVAQGVALSSTDVVLPGATATSGVAEAGGQSDA
jgi:hypothetical protein